MEEVGALESSWNPISDNTIHRPTSAPPVMELTQQLNLAELAVGKGSTPETVDPNYFMNSRQTQAEPTNEQIFYMEQPEEYNEKEDIYHSASFDPLKASTHFQQIPNGIPLQHPSGYANMGPYEIQNRQILNGMQNSGQASHPHLIHGMQNHYYHQPYMNVPADGMFRPHLPAVNSQNGFYNYSHSFQSPDAQSRAPMYEYAPHIAPYGHPGHQNNNMNSRHSMTENFGSLDYFPSSAAIPVQQRSIPSRSQSPPISAHEEPKQEIWTSKNNSRFRSKNGKFSLSSEPSLSSSTEDLLSLAGKPHLARDNLHNGSTGSLEFGGSLSDLPVLNGIQNQSPRSPRSPQPTKKNIKIQKQIPANSKSAAVGSQTNHFVDVASSPQDSSVHLSTWNFSSGNDEFSGLISGVPISNPSPSIAHPEFVMGSGSPIQTHRIPNGNAAPGSMAGSVCHYFTGGYCSKGEKCRYLHLEDPNNPNSDLRNAPGQRKTPRAPVSVIAAPAASLGQTQTTNNQAQSLIGLPSVLANQSGQINSNSVQQPLSANQSPTIPISSPVYHQIPAASASALAPRQQVSPSSNQVAVVSNASSQTGASLPASSPARYTSLTIEECTGQIYQMCKDQYGCRFLQKKLDEDKTSATCDAIFAEILPEIVELMSDPFGNYLCQKLIEKCSPTQRLAIVKGVSGHLVQISKNMHGTRAVQKTIEQLGSGDEIRLVRDALKGSVVALIQDLNGNHVIQKCIHRLEPNDNQFIYDAVAQHCVQVATHRHGCCVMQRCIDHASTQQKLQLVNEIKNNALNLVQDQFGNYVVQYVLDLGIESVCEALAINLLGHLYYLSTQKFSSNVIEKCLKVGNAATVQVMSKELAEFQNDPKHPIFPNSPNEDPLICLLQHPFGNYVVQTALQVALVKAPKEWNQIAARIKPHLPNLRSNTYVKRVQVLLVQAAKGELGTNSSSSQGLEEAHSEADTNVTERLDASPIRENVMANESRNDQKPNHHHVGRGHHSSSNNRGNKENGNRSHHNNGRHAKERSGGDQQHRGGALRHK